MFVCFITDSLFFSTSCDIFFIFDSLLISVLVLCAREFDPCSRIWFARHKKEQSNLLLHHSNSLPVLIFHKYFTEIKIYTVENNIESLEMRMNTDDKGLAKPTVLNTFHFLSGHSKLFEEFWLRMAELYALIGI